MRVTSTLPRAARSLHYLRSTRALIFLIRGRAAPFAGTLPYGERSPFSSIKHAPTVRHNLVSRARSALFIVAVAVVPMILAPLSAVAQKAGTMPYRMNVEAMCDLGERVKEGGESRVDASFYMDAVLRRTPA